MSSLFGAGPLRAISLWQPWATAVAIGWKANETRHWPTQHRGELAVHAAKRWSPECRAMHQGQCTANGFPAEIPFGAIVAVASVDDCVPVGVALGTLTPREEAWGNYGAGRWVWFLSNIRPLAEPVETVGRQGFWTLSDEVSALVRERTA